MRKSVEYRDWVAGVRRLAAEPELAVVREVLEALANEGLKDMDPINRFTEAHTNDLGRRELWIAADRVEAAIPDNPEAALLAAAVILCVWNAVMGKELYGQSNGMPPSGWVQFPYVCAAAAFKAGAIDEAARLVERGLDVLNAAKYRDDPRLVSAIARYRALAVEVDARWRSGIDTLASELRASCRADAPNFRAEVGALLWSLGLVPESAMLAPGADASVLPALRLCRQVVLVSLLGVAHDPLTQYVWLEMKDREPFNIRDHAVFFGTINLCYHTHLADDFMPEPPSQVFARTLIAWFRGDLDLRLAHQYAEAYRLVESEFPHSVDWPIYIRMRVLATMVGERFDMLTPEGVLRIPEMLGELAHNSWSLNRNAFAHPDWPEPYTRTSTPVFALLERFNASPDRVADAVDLIEQFRAASMQYWLAASPPEPPPLEAEAAAPLLERESQLIKELKGAYFLMLAPILPMHYKRSAAEIDPGDPESMKYPDTSKGLDEYKRILGELGELHKEMQSVAPTYVRQRLAPIANLTSLAEALGAHRARS